MIYHVHKLNIRLVKLSQIFPEQVNVFTFIFNFKYVQKIIDPLNFYKKLYLNRTTCFEPIGEKCHFCLKQLLSNSFTKKKKPLYYLDLKRKRKK